MSTLNPSKKFKNRKKKFFKRSYVLRILRRFRKKTPILLNRMSKNGLGRFLGEPTLKCIRNIKLSKNEMILLKNKYNGGDPVG